MNTECVLNVDVLIAFLASSSATLAGGDDGKEDEIKCNNTLVIFGVRFGVTKAEATHKEKERETKENKSFHPVDETNEIS